MPRRGPRAPISLASDSASCNATIPTNAVHPADMSSIVLARHVHSNCVPRSNRTHNGRAYASFGLSDEDVSVQQKYLEKVPVSYPLLTQKGKVPNLYRDIARYPAIFLVDRSGRLQPAPGPDQPFEKLQVAVDNLLNKRP
jgi:hypothetical protein